MGAPSKGGPFGQVIRRNIQACRSRSGLSQASLSEKCGLSLEKLTNYEQGQGIPSIDELTRIATCLGVPMSDLIG